MHLARTLSILVYSATFTFALFIIGCSDSSPSVRQNSPPPNVSSQTLTITDLDSSALVTGTCDDLGKFDKGFEIQLDGSTWIRQSSVLCNHGTFSIRIEQLGRKMNFEASKKSTKSAALKRNSATGKSSEISILVQFLPDVLPGGFSEGGAVTKSASTDPSKPKYILRGSFSGAQKESGSTLVSSDAKFKMVLSRDKGRM